ncbi:MAG: TraR/DksA family transcriptional regulator [Anaerolineae bacterium]
MERQKEILDKELESIEEQIEALESALKVKPEYGMGKGDPAITQWELDQAMLERLKNHAAELRQALNRLEEGTYGICERCGKPIDPNRLAVLPDTKICAACAQKG